MSDYLTPLPVARVAGWYRRLANSMAGRTVSDGAGADGREIQRQPLAAVFLGHYLDNRQRDSTFAFDPPDYLRHASQVTAQLQYHRAVFLTQQRARLSNREVWAGVLPRIQGQSGFQRWDLQRSVEMSYESLVEVEWGSWISAGFRCGAPTRSGTCSPPCAGFNFAAVPRWPATGFPPADPASPSRPGPRGSAIPTTSTSTSI